MHGSDVGIGTPPSCNPQFVIRLCYDYHLVMTIVNVATLKEKLSYYLQLVRGGSEVVVTSHETRIARIVPIDAPSIEIIEPKRSPSELRKLKGIKPRAVSAVDLLIEDRRKR